MRSLLLASIPVWKRNTDGFRDLMRLETRRCLPFEGSMTRNSASQPWNYTAERSAPLYLWQGVETRFHNNTTSSQRLRIVIGAPFIPFWCLISSLFVLFKIHISTDALRHRWHEKSLRSGVSWICFHVAAFHWEIIPLSCCKTLPATWFALLHAEHRHLTVFQESVCVRRLVLMS